MMQVIVSYISAYTLHVISVTLGILRWHTILFLSKLYGHQTLLAPPGHLLSDFLENQALGSKGVTKAYLLNLGPERSCQIGQQG